MLENGFTSFNSMDDDALLSLMAWVAQRPGKKKSVTINRRTRDQFYQVLRELHQFAIDGLIPDGIRSDPRTLKRRLLAKVGNLPGHSRNNTPRIPERLARHLLGYAILWIEEVAPYLRRAIDAVGPWSPLSNDEKRIRLRTFLETNPPSPVFGLRIGSVHDLVKAARLLISASLIVVAAFTGFRISEVLSIMIGCVRTVTMAQPWSPKS
jgi:integrase